MVSKNELTPPWYVSLSSRLFKNDLITRISGFSSGYFFIRNLTNLTQYIPFVRLKEMSTLIFVFLSWSLIKGTLVNLSGSMLLQIPDLRSEFDKRFIIVNSLTYGWYTSRSMSEFGKFKVVAQDPNTITTASGYDSFTTFLIFFTRLSRCNLFSLDS